MQFKRTYVERLEKRMKGPRRFIQVLLGPRQVGKTTIVNQFSSGLKVPYISVSADAVLTPGWIDQQWELARLRLKQSGARQFLLIIDEIQKIPNWSEVVKKHWDIDSRNKINIKIL